MCGMTQNKMVQRGDRRYEKQGHKQLKTEEGRLWEVDKTEDSHPSICSKWKSAVRRIRIILY
jgi:hypothetical protein